MDDSRPVAKIWPVEFWQRNDVSVWLTAINMKKYNMALRRSDICGRSLILLNEQELRDMGVDSLGDRKALLYEIQRLDKWEGFLWRYELEDANSDASVTLELVLSLSPNKMSAICCVRDANGNEEIPNVRVTWSFTHGDAKNEDAIERFSTQACYDQKQNRSIIRLPCPVSEAEVEVEMV
ncbi:GTA-1-like protein [Spironucleus salmonicida]|uniref:GTA-1-like protein n=1 Tax=Spironucleus salmonicida TaxID=348837 RepID=V6LI54_9EUKA|nr:GTA-1-like protein [Spironucleus salmonicida]|eukprot:EST43998.1 GTA-1-like protein [Spironucleus salmonicida]